MKKANASRRKPTPLSGTDRHYSPEAVEAARRLAPIPPDEVEALLRRMRWVTGQDPMPETKLPPMRREETR